MIYQRLSNIKVNDRRTLKLIPLLGTAPRFMSSDVDNWDSIVLCHVDASRSIVSVTGSEHRQDHVHPLSINLGYLLDCEYMVLG